MSEIAKHWIDGQLVGSDTVSEAVTPAAGAVLGEWADGGEAEARAAIAAARRAFQASPWSRDPSLRHRALNEMADRFDAHAEELGTLVTKENGKKIAEGLFEGNSPSPTLRHSAAQALTGTGIAAEVAPGQWFSTYAEPAGVVGIIVPWNSPVALLIRSLGPALSAGNTVAVKMPGQTALLANLGSRILVQRGAARRARPRLAGLLENVRVGDGMDPKTDMGPLIDRADVDRVDRLVQAALAYAKPIVRGGPATDGALAAGAFYRPTLLEVEDVSTDLVQKEVFGPVATFEVFATETDAIARANATEYGLAAGIFTSSINTSRRVSREIQAGTVWTNTWAAINDGFAEGGYKQSGIGRLRGPPPITDFEEAKTVVHSIPPFRV